MMKCEYCKKMKAHLSLHHTENKWQCSDCWKKESETIVFNDVANSFIKYELKIKTLKRLRSSTVPKFPIQQNIERYI